MSLSLTIEDLRMSETLVYLSFYDGSRELSYIGSGGLLEYPMSAEISIFYV